MSAGEWLHKEETRQVCEKRLEKWIWSADNIRKQFGTLAKINSSDHKTVPKYSYLPVNCLQSPQGTFLFIHVPYDFHNYNIFHNGNFSFILARSVPHLWWWE